MNNLSLLERKYSGRRAELKRIILDQALTCFLQHGIEMTTIEMIRESAETSVGAIYHHFKNKEGLVTALYFAAIDDQAERRDQALQKAQNLQQGIRAIIESYIDWVMEYPNFARFLYIANFSIRQSEQDDELKQKNHLRNQHLLTWMKQQQGFGIIENIPHELLLSLIIGAVDSYCRAWLSHKVKSAPTEYKQQLSDAAWHSIEQFKF